MASIFGYIPGIFDDLKWLLAFIFGVMIAFFVVDMLLNRLFPRRLTKKELKLHRVKLLTEDEDEDEDEEYWGP